MKTKMLFQLMIIGLLTLSLLAASPLNAQDKQPISKPDKSDSEQATTPSDRQDEATSQAEEKTDEKRKEIISEAAEALSETKSALAALDQDKSKEALAALERASGKLAIVLAREPELALAPVDVATTAHDLYTTLDTIKEARQQAEDYLEEGEIQKARPLIDALASEIIIHVYHLPLATYPDALKSAAALIDDGKPNEA
jgi:beta-glucosidase-like glycosyl hydrolase